MAWPSSLRHIQLIALLAASVSAQVQTGQNLALTDCGIGTNPEDRTWSTSRQINWYRGPIWSSSDETDPAVPDEYVELPYGDGKYPWNYEGANATLPNGDFWAVWIEDGTPEPQRAGRATSPKDGGTELWCYTYRGRAVSTSMSEPSKICVTAFVCNTLENGPTPWSQTGGQSSPNPTDPGSGEPAPQDPQDPPTSPNPPQEGEPSADGSTINVNVELSPRPGMWLGSVDEFINSIDYTDANICSPTPIANGANSSIVVTCQATHDTNLQLMPVFLRAIRNLGALRGPGRWFSHNPGKNLNDTSDDTFQLPQKFTLIATDAQTSDVKGFISWEVRYTTDPMAMHCSECLESKFDGDYNDAITSAFATVFPVYSRVVLRSTCTAQMVCG